jgi:hypothetical protein
MTKGYIRADHSPPLRFGVLGKVLDGEGAEV